MANRFGRRYFIMACLLLIGLSTPAHAQVTFEVLHGFVGGLDGATPYSGVVQGTDGNFYGTTLRGGNGATSLCYSGGTGCGTVFQMTPSGVVTVLHAFAGGSDGDSPVAPLVQASDGNFYGTTQVGGASCADCGTFFRITPAGTLTTLHSFTTALGRGGSRAALIQASDGNFYGMFNGGIGGAILRIAPDGTTTSVHVFDFYTEGDESDAPLLQALDGNLYGTTYSGGNVNGSGGGAIFKMSLAGDFTLLHTFTDVAGGSEPGNGLIQGLDGNFYGLTFRGGTDDRGTIFKMTPSGVVTVLASLTNINGPHYTSLLQGTDGNFYGTSTAYAFKLTPGGTLTQLRSVGQFTGPLVHGHDGFLYGTRADSSFDNPGSALGDVYRIGNYATCDDALALSDIGGTLHLGFTLKTLSAASWSSWIVIQANVYPLWVSAALPIITPSVFVDLPIPGFPHVGQVFMLTTLTTTSGACFDWKTVNTQ